MQHKLDLKDYFPFEICRNLLIHYSTKSSNWVKTQTLVPVKPEVKSSQILLHSLLVSTVLYLRLCVFLASGSSVEIELQVATSHYKPISFDEKAIFFKAENHK